MRNMTKEENKKFSQFKDKKFNAVFVVDEKDKQTLLKVKSLLSHLSYLIKEEHFDVVDKFHSGLSLQAE